MTFESSAWKRGIPAIALCLALAGCAGVYGPSATEREFGNSVRHVVESQKANPEASRDPDPNPVNYGDGARLEPVLEAYRTDVGTPSEVKRDVLINLSR
jgi:hypothetical protein